MASASLPGGADAAQRLVDRDEPGGGLRFAGDALFLQAQQRAFGVEHADEVGHAVAVTRAGAGAALSPRQRREQRAQFLVHLAGLGEGLGNLVTQQFAVALAQAVDGHAQGAFVHAELLGRFAVGNGRGADREEALRLREQLRLAVAGTFRRQDG